MNRKTLAYVLIALAIGVSGYWLATGRELYTLTQVEEKVVDTDNPFADPNDPVTESVWRDEFRPGLLDLIGPIAGGLLVISGVLLWSDARRRRRAAGAASLDNRTH